MKQARHFIVCPKRSGQHRISVELCPACKHARRCPAWASYRCPPLFAGLFDKPQPRD